MRLGIAQIHTTAGAFEETVERMVTLSQGAAEQGVELLVFPLAALAGVGVVPYADRVPFQHDTAEALVALSERLACPALVPVPIDLGEPESFFDALLIDGSEIRPIRMMSRMRSLAEPSADQDISEFSYGGVRWALAFSHEDLDVLGDYDYDMDAVLFVSGYPFALDDPSSAHGCDLENGRYVEDARAMGCWLVGVASLGGYGDEVFTGASFVLAPGGELRASAPAFEESLLVTDIEVPADEHAGEAVPPEVFDAPFHLWQAISLGIHDFVAAQGKTDVALVLDGTISSQVLAALATDALGPLHVHALVGASAGPKAPASRELCRRLRIDQVDGVAALPGFDAHDTDELGLAKLAREHGALLLSSLDKTALALGAAHGLVRVAELCPLGDVYRSDILDMAHVRNTISPLFRRVGLSSADAIDIRMGDGTTYRVEREAELARVDEVLLGYIEYDRPLNELATDADEHDTAVVDAVLRTERSFELWRRSMPPVLAMSTHTLDDARFPLGVRWHDSHLTGFDDPMGAFTAPEEGADSGDRASHAQRKGSFDLEGTLAMLRDLAEQGGFEPTSLGQGAASETTGQPPSMPGFGLPGLMSPFSEN